MSHSHPTHLGPVSAQTFLICGVLVVHNSLPVEALQVLGYLCAAGALEHLHRLHQTSHHLVQGGGGGWEREGGFDETIAW